MCIRDSSNTTPGNSDFAARKRAAAPEETVMPQRRPRRSGVIDRGELRFHAHADHRLGAYNQVLALQITEGNVDETGLILGIDQALIGVRVEPQFSSVDDA